MGKFRDLTGEIFNRLTVIGLSHSITYSSYKTYYWNCICECGNTKIVQSSNLRSGSVSSCGCRLKEIDRRRFTHRMSKSSEYKSWESMKARCNNPKSTKYSHYGARGIKICDRWNSSFENFLEDMGSKPTCKHSIDRIDPEGNYEPGNCRWSTNKEQSLNKRNTVKITYQGETLTFADWSIRTGISESKLRDRYYRKLPIEKIFSTKEKKYLRDSL